AWSASSCIRAVQQEAREHEEQDQPGVRREQQMVQQRVARAVVAVVAVQPDVEDEDAERGKPADAVERGAVRLGGGLGGHRRWRTPDAKPPPWIWIPGQDHSASSTRSTSSTATSAAGSRRPTRRAAPTWSRCPTAGTAPC